MSAELCHTPGKTDSISKLAWSKDGTNFLATSNWDGNVRIYHPNESGVFNHVASASTHGTSPALCVDWHNERDSLFSCGVDNTAVKCSLAGGAIVPTTVAHHKAPIKSLTWWSEANVLVTGGFDNAMMYWDLRQPQPVHRMECPGKVQCVASKGPTMVMTCLNKSIDEPTCKSAVYAFDKSRMFDNIRCVVPEGERTKLTKGQTFPVEHRSPLCLSHQIRSIGMMRNGEGWTLGGTEGRAVVEYRADAAVPPCWPRLEKLFTSATPGAVQHAMTANFNFKCHRVDVNDKAGVKNSQNKQSETRAYPVHGVSFNGKYNTLATCGGDGTLVFWDKDNRQRLKGFPEHTSKVGYTTTTSIKPFDNSIIDIDFSPDSAFVAYAVAYDWSKGLEGKTTAGEGLYVKRVLDADIMPKKT